MGTGSGGSNGIEPRPLTYFDVTGKAALFRSIPLLTMKKAKFIRIAGAIHTLSKIVVNGVNYNISETSRNGAVVLRDQYTRWEFVAPDGALSFDRYKTMTIGEGLSLLQEELRANPITPWDKFVAWLGENFGSIEPSKQARFFIYPIGNANQLLPISSVTFEGLTTFEEFISRLTTSLEPILDMEMSQHAQSDHSFGFVLRITTVEETSEVASYSMRRSVDWDCEALDHDIGDDGYCIHCGYRDCDILDHEMDENGNCIHCGEYVWDCAVHDHKWETDGSLIYCVHCNEVKRDCEVDGHEWDINDQCVHCGVSHSDVWDCNGKDNHEWMINGSFPYCVYCGEYHDCNKHGHLVQENGYCVTCEKLVGSADWDCMKSGHIWGSSSCNVCGIVRDCGTYGHEFEYEEDGEIVLADYCIYCGASRGEDDGGKAEVNQVDIVIIFRE